MAKPQSFIKLLLDPTTEQELTELAQHLRVTRSAVVRMAVRRLHTAEGLGSRQPATPAVQGEQRDASSS